MAQCEKRRRSEKKEVSFVHMIAAGDGEKRRDPKLKWLTCSKFFVMRAL